MAKHLTWKIHVEKFSHRFKTRIKEKKPPITINDLQNGSGWNIFLKIVYSSYMSELLPNRSHFLSTLESQNLTNTGTV